MTDRRITRRHLVGTGAGMAGGLALAGGQVGRRVASARAQGELTQYQGQLVIAISNNVPDVAQQALTAAYNQHQPGVELIWETQDLPPAEYTSFLGTQLAAGDPRLDIVSGNYLANYRGYVNLDQYRSTVNPYTGNRWDEDLNWDFYRSVDAAGERNMLATRSVHINWFYNKNLFAQAGVEPPTSWAAFVEVCTKLSEAGITPIVANFDYQVPQWFAEVYFDQYHIHWIETVRAQPGDWNYDPAIDDAFVFDPTNPNIHNTYTFNRQRLFQGIRDGTLRFDTPEIAEVARNMAAIFPRYATGDFFVIADHYPVFLQQQAAIMPNGSWALGQLQRDLESLSPERLEDLGIEAGSVETFEWGTFENPPMEGDLVKSPVRSVESASGEYMSIVRKSQEQTDMAVDFLMFWLSPAGYQPYLDAYAQHPDFGASGPIEVRGVSDPPEYQELFAGIKMLGNAEINYNYIWTSSASTTIHQDLRGMFQRVLEGETSPEDYAAELQTYFTDNLDAVLEAEGLTAEDIDDPARQPGT